MVVCLCLIVTLSCNYKIHVVFNAADDETRVKLKGLLHDYINANYIHVSLRAGFFTAN